MPGPEGASDRTFTYYTKSLLGRDGGKHQVRLRTYVRSLSVHFIKPGQIIKGFFEQNAFTIERSKHRDSYLFEIEGNQYNLSKQSYLKLGETLYFTRPWKKLKLEIKTRLPELMESSSYKKLEGDNTFKNYLLAPSYARQIDYLEKLAEQERKNCH